MATSPVPVKQAAPSPTLSTDPWRSLRTEMDRLFDRFTSGFGLAPFAGRIESGFTVASPAIDITEDDAAYRLTAEIPGISEKDIQISLSGDTLTIKGEKRQEREEKEKNDYLSERSYGQFQRAFVLPDCVDAEQIGAAFGNGVLTVTLPKTAKAAPKTVEMKSAA